MKTLFFITLLAILMGCGKKNLVNSANNGGVSGNTSIETSAFLGTYDLVEANSNDCAANIQIVSDCRGFKLMSNIMGPEEFCNVNLGEQTSSANLPDRAPPPPDRRPPPPPDRRPPPPPPAGVSASSTVVTLEGNQLKSVTTVGPGVAFSNTLILNQSRLTKITNLKSRSSTCLFEKR